MAFGESRSKQTVGLALIGQPPHRTHLRICRKIGMTSEGSVAGCVLWNCPGTIRQRNYGIQPAIGCAVRADKACRCNVWQARGYRGAILIGICQSKIYPYRIFCHKVDRGVACWVGCGNVYTRLQVGRPAAEFHPIGDANCESCQSIGSGGGGAGSGGNGCSGVVECGNCDSTKSWFERSTYTVMIIVQKDCTLNLVGNTVGARIGRGRRWPCC